MGYMCLRVKRGRRSAIKEFSHRVHREHRENTEKLPGRAWERRTLVLQVFSLSSKRQKRRVAYVAMPTRLSRGKWFLRPRDPLYVFLKSVSRRREKQKRLRRDAAFGNAPNEKTKPALRYITWSPLIIQEIQGNIRGIERVCGMADYAIRAD